MTSVRSLFFRIVLFGSAGVLALVFFPVLFAGKKGARWLAQLWARLVIFELKMICGITHKIENNASLPTGGAIIASNHQSMWETIVLFALLSKPVIVVKRELLNIPVFGWLLRPAGNIVIDRDGGAKALRAIARQAKEAVDAGEQVVIFPEGTRVPPGGTGRYQPGVAGVYAGANAPCYPIAHNSGEFWRYPGFMKLPGVITVRLLEPIESGLNRKEFMKRLEQSINDARPDLVGDAPHGA